MISDWYINKNMDMHITSIQVQFDCGHTGAC